ncbi:hypothetical protein HY635_01665 [Candidatus Uhrbacteria bacterium]|nr:hypothetical protein [Candidatus Uhrbacteria bacterium]
MSSSPNLRILFGIVTTAFVAASAVVFGQVNPSSPVDVDEPLTTVRDAVPEVQAVPPLIEQVLREGPGRLAEIRRDAARELNITLPETVGERDQYQGEYESEIGRPYFAMVRLLEITRLHTNNGNYDFAMRQARLFDGRYHSIRNYLDYVPVERQQRAQRAADEKAALAGIAKYLAVRIPPRYKVQSATASQDSFFISLGGVPERGYSGLIEIYVHRTDYTSIPAYLKDSGARSSGTMTIRGVRWYRYRIDGKGGLSDCYGLIKKQRHYAMCFTEEPPIGRMDTSKIRKDFAAIARSARVVR